MCIALSVAATALSRCRDSTSQLLFNVSTSSVYGVFWSIILSVIVCICFRHEGALIRTCALIAGFVGFVVLQSMYIVPMFFEASRLSSRPISEGHLIAMSLVAMSWILGIWWFIEAFSLSVIAVDWKNTIWTRGNRRS